MNIESITQAKTAGVAEQVSVSMLKKSMDVQQAAALKLLEALPELQDPALGQNIDTTA
ncbi:MAG: putative motility protein [Spirochaetaceae bacterium]|nr:MAG: putative motility protein [Spirochaetaceae bacterium]